MAEIHADLPLKLLGHPQTRTVNDWPGMTFEGGTDPSLLHHLLGLVQVAGDEEQLPDQAPKRAGPSGSVRYLHAGRCWMVPSGGLRLWSIQTSRRSCTSQSRRIWPNFAS
jgi:hypothetical protein